MEKRGLGRGLAALIAEAQDSDGAQVQEIPISQISPSPYQPRTLFDPIKMEELVASVKEHGVLQPVLARRIGHERFQLVAGERRLRAAQKAGLASVPALVRDLADREVLEVAMVENLQREDIGVLEAAHAYRRLGSEFGMTQESIARRVGKSRSAVANTLRLLNLPPKVQESLEQGTVSEGHARALLPLEADGVILQAWDTVVRRKLSVRATESLVREMLHMRSRAESEAEPVLAVAHVRDEDDRVHSGRDPITAHAVAAIQQSLGTRVTIRRHAGDRGTIEIDFYSSEDLQRLLDLLMTHGAAL
jgi:ParB family chromosome partitioning protein